MAILTYAIDIQATPEVVWDTLWNDKTYRQWTAAFQEGSHAVSNWNEGDPIKFLGPSKDGMYGIIDKKILHQEMVFRHLGEIKNGVEEPKDWGDAIEAYLLTPTPNGTHLTANLKMNIEKQEFADYFNMAFPKAFSLLKEICEQEQAAAN